MFKSMIHCPAPVNMMALWSENNRKNHYEICEGFINRDFSDEFYRIPFEITCYWQPHDYRDFILQRFFVEYPQYVYRIILSDDSGVCKLDMKFWFSSKKESEVSFLISKINLADDEVDEAIENLKFNVSSDFNWHGYIKEARRFHNENQWFSMEFEKYVNEKAFGIFDDFHNIREKSRFR